jgi:hypothetical protein
MLHTRQEIIKRTIAEFELLDQLVSGLTEEQWSCSLLRPKSKDPWTVKDALAHITHWKAATARSALGLPPSPEEHGLTDSQANHIIYMRWRDRPAHQVLEWHRQVQQDVLAALRTAPEEWFSKRERREQWPFGLDGHSAEHRMRDIERALREKAQL